jgi:DNA-binding PadR family transcriptional regulator
MVRTVTQDIQLTPTSYIVLGLLDRAGEASPYQLTRLADASVGNFWSLPRSQLYSEPARLARAGYLSEEQEQSGRRRKRYVLTERGSHALRRWTEEPTYDYPELRDPSLLKIFFGADPQAMAAAQLSTLLPLLAKFEEMRAKDTGDGPDGPRQTLQVGIDHVETSIRAWERIARECSDADEVAVEQALTPAVT